MKTARNQFLLTAMLALFVLLSVILAAINIADFAMAEIDADTVTQMIAQNEGNPPEQLPGEFPEDFRRGPMGPDSPELRDSVRYFTVAFYENGTAQVISYNINAVSREEAADWAKSLTAGTTGWTRTTYRYRVYQTGDKVCVTVIDQGRELISSFRTLKISIIGGTIGLAIAFVVLLYASRRIIKPIEDADRRQKKFMADAEKEFKVPLTVISANTELLEREHGSSEQTQSINRQVRKMTALVSRIGEMSVIPENGAPAAVNLSDLIRQMTEVEKPVFEAAGIRLATEIESGVQVAGEEKVFRKILEEIIANAEDYSISKAKFVLRKDKERVILIESNDTSLPDMDANHAFDRFTRLENAGGVEGAGLGLSYVREWVQDYGRIDAKVENGCFRIRITL